MTCTKRAYATKGEAKLALRGIRSFRRHQGSKRQEDHAYRCPMCGAYHLASWNIWTGRDVIERIRKEARG